MSNKYENSKIFKIEGYDLPPFIGTTIISLSQRLAQYRSDYKKYLEKKRPFTTLYKIFDKGNDYKISLIENYPCKDKQDLFMRFLDVCSKMECLNNNNDNNKTMIQQPNLPNKKKPYYILHKEKLRQKTRKYYQLKCQLKKEQEQEVPVE